MIINYNNTLIVEEGEAWQCRAIATPAHEARCLYCNMSVCLSVCPKLLGVWLYVCHLVFVKAAVCVRKPSETATRTLCFGAPVEVIRKNVSCAFKASQVCVTVVGFGFTWRQTSSLYGYGNREKRQPLIVVLEGTRVPRYHGTPSTRVRVPGRYPAFPPSTLFHPRAVGSPVYK
jgi:hypothetical protein